MLFNLPLILAMVVLAVATYWLILLYASQKIVEQYRALAKILGIDLNEPRPVMGGLIRPEPSLYGHFDGREISISVPGKGLQNTRQNETVLKVRFNDPRFRAQVVAGGFLGGLKQRDARGLKRWNSGDPSFDSTWDLRAAPQQPTGQVFDAAVRERIAALLQAGKGSLYIGGSVIAYAEIGLISKESTRQRFETAVALAADLAETIENL